MDMTLVLFIASITISVIFTLGGFIMKSLVDRINTLEQKVTGTVTVGEVRELLADKIDPIKEDVTDIKTSVTKLYELYCTGKKE